VVVVIISRFLKCFSLYRLIVVTILGQCTIIRLATIWRHEAEDFVVIFGHKYLNNNFIINYMMMKNHNNYGFSSSSSVFFFF
jgi:hypothetical protein